jgi:hypothetical protein
MTGQVPDGPGLVGGAWKESGPQNYCDMLCSSVVLLASVCQDQPGLSVGVARCSVGVVYRSAREARNEGGKG